MGLLRGFKMGAFVLTLIAGFIWAARILHTTLHAYEWFVLAMVVLGVLGLFQVFFDPEAREDPRAPRRFAMSVCCIIAALIGLFFDSFPLTIKDIQTRQENGKVAITGTLENPYPFALYGVWVTVLDHATGMDVSHGEVEIKKIEAGMAASFVAPVPSARRIAQADVTAEGYWTRPPRLNRAR